ncbi:MAG TPA: dihydrodipicolinate synthase family protein [Candidatus Latescibacteria bacterium]|jgi:4-hydroxy-tetrahydrodipicolinate synthase|nr:dihydrodipicolinate synthase family protein [Candidatus Latescibacterota bacterium]HJP30504.1 dihydrodipicolinate synthase family protein [Candidatus Latescibacterota bacterium]
MNRHESFRGIFPVVLTPIGADGDVLYDELTKQVEFCLAGGAHGLVFPVLGSEFQYLTQQERRRGMETIVRAADGRLPVVGGVAAPSRQVAVEVTREAAGTGVDAVIALPPYISAGSAAEIRTYYEEVAAAAGRPVFVQHTTAGMTSDFLQKLLREVEHVRYLKEEMQPSAHQISAVLAGIGDACDGVFGGAHGRWMLSEMARGAHGFMPATEAVDVHVQVWDAWQSGNEAEARRIYGQLLPFINLVLLIGLPVCKTLLQRRGVFSSAAMRTPGSPTLDAGDERELDAILEGLRPLFRV